MTIPNSRYNIKYQGSGADDETYYIPFGFDIVGVIHVETIDSDGIATQKTVTVDYNITATNSDGSTAPVADDVPAEYGWIIWIGASPTDIVHIYREETPRQPYDLLVGATTVFDSIEFERALDILAQSISRNIKRMESNPLVFDALGRAIKNLGDPVRHDDALTNDTLNIMNVTPSLTVPDSPAPDELLSPDGYVPTESVAWRLGHPRPDDPADMDAVLRSTGTGSNFDWSVQLWIPPAPNDGLSYFLYTDQNGNMSWEQVYEVPTGGTEDQIVFLDYGELISWRTTREAAVQDLAVSLDRFVMLDTSGDPTWSPRFAAGIEAMATQAHTGVVGTSEHHTIDETTFEITHGLVDDAGSAVVPDRVYLMLETEKQLGKIPTFLMRLNYLDDSDPNQGGITDTVLRGSYSLLNCNDHMFSGGSVDGSLTYSSLDVKIHWLVMRLNP